mgnify:CR=1 FL=1
MIRNWPIPEDVVDERIDVVLARIGEMSRAASASLLDDDRVQLNGKVVSKSAKVSFGDAIEVELPDPDMGSVEPTVELPIVFQDDDFVVFTNFAHHNPLQHFGSQRNDFHKTLSTQFTRYWAENTSSDRFKFCV